MNSPANIPKLVQRIILYISKTSNSPTKKEITKELGNLEVGELLILKKAIAVNIHSEEYKTILGVIKDVEQKLNKSKTKISLFSTAKAHLTNYYMLCDVPDVTVKEMYKYRNLFIESLDDLNKKEILLLLSYISNKKDNMGIVIPDIVKILNKYT